MYMYNCFFFKVASSGVDMDQFVSTVTTDEILENSSGLANLEKIKFVVGEEVKGTLVSGRYSGYLNSA